MDVSFEETHRRYRAALETALAEFRGLLSSSNSKQWAPVPSSALQPSGSKPRTGEAHSLQFLNGFGPLDLSTVQVHRKKLDGAMVVRAVCAVPVDRDRVDVDDLRAVIQTAEIRAVWDSLVEKASVLEILDPHTRIVKTDFRLGWPAHPRDSVTISKTLSDSNTIIDISTSLPQTADEPAYLRPSPPFVRSHVHLLAWCIQLSPRPPSSNQSLTLDSNGSGADQLTPSESSQRPSSTESAKARITVFWQINWKGALFSTQHVQIASSLNGFVECVRSISSQIPMVFWYGSGIDFGSTCYDKTGEKLYVNYSILPQGSTLDQTQSEGSPDMSNGVTRLEAALELKLPVEQGWDVHITTGDHVQHLEEAFQTVSERPPGASRTLLRISHVALPPAHQLLRVKVTVQRLAGGKSLRVNQKPVQSQRLEPRSNSSPFQPLLDDTKSLSNLSHNSATTDESRFMSDTVPPPIPSPGSPVRSSIKSSSQIKRPISSSRAGTIEALVKRSYIYFSSLLQEPEAKWKHFTDSRGVTVTQLQSIDPTLTVYRAEATFVGVGVWNVFGAIATPGARLHWDKSLADLSLLEDLNELSSLWHLKHKGAWPVAPRDSVLVVTTYKSPAAIHFFSVSTDDVDLFPSIQPANPGCIRTRTEIIGWSIESLSPTTIQITLIDQHDPMGWAPKSWTPSQLTNQVASLGDFALKHGGPPIITRISGARVTLSKYEHDKGTFRAEYSTSESALVPALSDPSGSSSQDIADSAPVECELRCDCETWSSSLDIVADPPPTKATCLKRHRLSAGGGWWIMIEHDRALLQQERAKVLIRRSNPDLRKGAVFLNGSEIKVDVECLTREEERNLAKKGRAKANLIPLDQYPLCGPRLWREVSGGPDELVEPAMSNSDCKPEEPPLTPPNLMVNVVPGPSSESKGAPQSTPPMLSALEGLAKLQSLHVEQSPDNMSPPPGWNIVTEKGTTSVYKKMVPLVSEVFPVFRVHKVVPGVTADEMVATLSAISLRPLWDSRIETASPLASYGHGCTTSLLTAKPNFPFKSRLLKLANVHAQVQLPSPSVASSVNTIHLLASSSFQGFDSMTFDSKKINPNEYVEAKVLLEGWIIETADPYCSSSHEIPSTRCTYFSAIDYSGSVPVALNSVLNSSLTRLVSGLETVVKTHGPLPKLCQPILGLGIDGPLGADDTDNWRWQLTGKEWPTVALLADATPNSVFQSTLLVRKSFVEFLSAPTFSPALPSPESPGANSNTKLDGVRVLGVSPSSPVEENGFQRARRLVSNPDLRRKASAGQFRRSATGNSAVGSHSVDLRTMELVIAEVSLDQKLYPHGFNICCRAKFVKGTTYLGSPCTIDLSHETQVDQMPLPVEVSVHEMPGPTYFAASLDPKSERVHKLLRLTLPIGSLHSPVKDSTTNNGTSEASPPPLWLSNMSKRDTIVHLRVEPTPNLDEPVKGVRKRADPGKQTAEPYEIIVNGEPKMVISLRDSQAMLNRWEVDDYTVEPLALSRVNRSRKSTTGRPPLVAQGMDALPEDLREPSGVSAKFVLEGEDAARASPIVDSTTGSPRKMLSPIKEDCDPHDNRNEKDLISGVANQALSTCYQVQSQNFLHLDRILNFYPLNQLKSLIKTHCVAPERRRTYTTRHIIVTALIFFLLGSLLRSLLLPNDFIVIPPGGARHPENKLLNLLGDRHHWREVRRLVQFRIFFIDSWTLMIAAVRNPSS